MASFIQGSFTPKNKDKYVGTYPIYCRSSWELYFARVCDENKNIEQWAHEPVKIPYVNPLTGKNTVYIPDFLIVFNDKYGNRRAELIEIKPYAETSLKEAKNQKQKMASVINEVKFKAAQIWAKSNGMVFRVVTEKQLFHNR